MSHNEGSSALPIAALLLIVGFGGIIIIPLSISYVGSFCSFVGSIPNIIYTIILLAGYRKFTELEEKGLQTHLAA